jgi:putative endonuclease
MNVKNLGKVGEDMACGYLESQGYQIIKRNFRSRLGELDIIAKEDDTLVFIEVKAKSNTDFGLPQEMVGYKKQQKLIKVAYSYLKEEKLDDISWRIDVVAIIKDKSGGKSIKLIKNAVEYFK